MAPQYIRLKKYDEIARKISATLGANSSFGVTGSTANGYPTISSDIDLFIIIPEKEIYNMTKRIYALRTFQLPSHKVLSEFALKRINVLFLYGEINAIPINLEIYSLNCVRQLLNLKQLIMKRFRTRPTANKVEFTNVIGARKWLKITNIQHAEGILSVLEGSIKMKGFTFVGNHLRKILSGRLYTDHYKITEFMTICFIKLLIESIKKNVFSEKCILNIFYKNKQFIEPVKEYYIALCRRLRGEINL